VKPVMPRSSGCSVGGYPTQSTVRVEDRTLTVRRTRDPDIALRFTDFLIAPRLVRVRRYVLASPGRVRSPDWEEPSSNVGGVPAGVVDQGRLELLLDVAVVMSAGSSVSAVSSTGRGTARFAFHSVGGVEAEDDHVEAGMA
jgi:hypothetical protein